MLVGCNRFAARDFASSEAMQGGVLEKCIELQRRGSLSFVIRLQH